MKQSGMISKDLIGTDCIVDSTTYGKYRGIIRGNSKSYGGPQINVLIIECLRPPSTVPECYPSGYVNREEYKPGTTQHFSIEEIFPINTEVCC